MWLLSTARAELHLFPSVEAAQLAGYAILSHVWDGKEQTFQETEAIRTRCAATRSNPRDFSSDKVRNACIVAQGQGYRWIWNDASCIDRTSSSELSEAINSMFSYYAHSEVCYAYLRDVPPDDGDGRVTFSPAFRASIWFKRGWTLQELIAPDEVIFLAWDWSVIGAKGKLAEELEHITMVPRSVLRLEEDIWTISVAQRMSWAARRATTRLEDEAYCLMGLFDINMPTLYGEGRNAFRRLQEEIMCKNIDTSLFAWSLRPWDRPSGEIVSCPGDDYIEHNEVSLLAPTPAYFLYSSRIRFAPDCLQKLAVSFPKSSEGVRFPSFSALSRAKLSTTTTREPPQSVGIPTFDITPYGIHARIPVVQVRDIAIAILFVSDSDTGLLGLILEECKNAADPLRPLYHACVLINGWARRLVSLTNVLERWPEYRDHFLSAPWRDIHLVHIPPRPPAVARLLTDRAGKSAAFRIPQRIYTRLAEAGFRLSMPTNVRLPWLGHPPATLVLHIRHGRTDVTVELVWGRCTRARQASGAPGSGPAQNSDGLELGPHWVRVGEHRSARGRPNDREEEASLSLESPLHDCCSDHVDDWPDRSRSFRLYGTPWPVIEVSLTFAPGLPPSATCTYVLARLQVVVLEYQSTKRWNLS